MDWNSCLYHYAQGHGGEYFGAGRPERLGDILNEGLFGIGDSDGTLLLEQHGLSVLVRCAAFAGYRTTTFQVQAQVRCTLERDFWLSIGRHMEARESVRKITRQLNKATQKLGISLQTDYGYPEVTDGRSIQSSDGEFTRTILQSVTLRELLVQYPGFEVSVYKNAPETADDPVHIITAGALPREFSLDGQNRYANEETPLRLMEEFSKALDGLISLALEAHAAVTAWRMPPLPKDK